ncbi:hypothetical protein [Scytonema hofmannii]|uniref:hypothetical protein n=1 Tax=Scytonema hofmannii TaxID=34078 RepID=UPI00191C8EE9|nr:hypothetical protein [Scytonema hofmannii]
MRKVEAKNVACRRLWIEIHGLLSSSVVVFSWEIGGYHWSLVTGHWSLVIGHWSLVTGHWSLVIGHWSLVKFVSCLYLHYCDDRTPIGGKLWKCP